MPPERRLRIAMIGQRGVPATFGGVERHVEELGARLAERGHEVTVFCRRNYAAERIPTHRGMLLRYTPTIGTKHLDAIVHSATSTASAVGRSFDVVHYHALGPSVLAAVPRYATRAKVACTVHGRDDLRGKWGRFPQLALRGAAWLSARVPDETIVVSHALAAYYRERHGAEPTVIPNGVQARPAAPADLVRTELGITGPYVLFVGRFVPEKAPDDLVRAFREIPGSVRLVLAGDSSYTDAFTSSLRALAAPDDRIVFTGFVGGRVLDALYANATAFVLPSKVEGLPLTLLEAASFGTPVVASSIPPHEEIVGARSGRAVLVPPGDVRALRGALAAALADPGTLAGGAEALREHVLRTYTWEAAADATERVYRRLTRVDR